MKISGTADLVAPPAAVFEALADAQVLASAIPGVQALDRIGTDTYRMTITAGVASVKGSYTGEIELSEQVPPHSFTLRGKASGAPGTVDATVRVTLAEQDGGTRLTYDADAVVGGMVGGVGQRMLSAVAARMAGQFFDSVDRLVTEQRAGTLVPGGAADGVPVPRAAADDVAAETTSPSRAAQAPPAPRGGDGDEDRVPFWVVLAGVGAGAFWALAGVVVGYRIAKGSRR